MRAVPLPVTVDEDLDQRVPEHEVESRLLQFVQVVPYAQLQAGQQSVKPLPANGLS